MASSKSSFSWKYYINKPNFTAAPVSLFKHLKQSEYFNVDIVPGMVLEVKSEDCTTCSLDNPCCFWLASVIKIHGFMALLRFKGFESDGSRDFWVNLGYNKNVYHIGMARDNGLPLQPPKCIEDRYEDWKQYMEKVVKKNDFVLIPEFCNKMDSIKDSRLSVGMKLEAFDKNCLNVKKLAIVDEAIGQRVRVKFQDAPSDDPGFWCSERSQLIHAMGWAAMIRCPIMASKDYCMESFVKTLFRRLHPKEASLDNFPPMPNLQHMPKFEPHMKIEVVDPLNLSTICVATIHEVMRNNYLVISVDGTSDKFCYHASSPYIFPAGFCYDNGITLHPPRGYKGAFHWDDYLRRTKSRAAPPSLFPRELVTNGFREGMFLEAVDLMEPQLICVAIVVKVFGRLLRIHFVGWEDTFDQWCDCSSPDLYPVGYSEAIGYRLEPPKDVIFEEPKKLAKPTLPNKQPARRGRGSGRKC